MSLEIGTRGRESQTKIEPSFRAATPAQVPTNKGAFSYTDNTTYQSNFNPNFTFDNFVEGKSNQLAKAASTKSLKIQRLLIIRFIFMAVWAG